MSNRSFNSCWIINCVQRGANVSLKYLGHSVSPERVVVDQGKVHAIDWPLPKNVKALRGFLGLTGNYRRFSSRYSTLAPFTALTKKNSFHWT